MRLPPFSLERHSDVLHDLLKDAKSKGLTSGDGFSESYPIFLPSTVELRPMESFLRRVYGAGRSVITLFRRYLHSHLLKR